MKDESGYDDSILYRISTSTGLLVDVRDIQVSDLDIFDIAAGLANTGRWFGQTSHFFSIAQHSVVMARHSRGGGPFGIASTVHDFLKVSFRCLMHDAHEAYFGDAPRPIKYTRQFAYWRNLEAKADRVIGLAHGFPNGFMTPEVKLLDNRCAIEEARTFCHPNVLERVLKIDPQKVFQGNFYLPEPWSPAYAKECFLKEYYDLTERLGIKPLGSAGRSGNVSGDPPGRDAQHVDGDRKKLRRRPKVRAG